MPISAEVWGGLHTSVEKQLKEWAGLVPGADLWGQAANKRKQAEVLRIWQLTLSVGLLRGRVGVLRQAVHKIRGTEIVPGGRRGLHAVHIDPAARLLIDGVLWAAGRRG